MGKRSIYMPGEKVSGAVKFRVLESDSRSIQKVEFVICGEARTKWYFESPNEI